MKKHLIISLIFLMPLLSQKLENKSSSDNNTSISLNEVSSLSVPRKVSYQGILTKSNGQPVSDNVYEVKFRLYKTAEDGEHFWVDQSLKEKVCQMKQLN